MLFLIIYTMYKRIKVGFLKKEFLRKIKECSKMMDAS